MSFIRAALNPRSFTSNPIMASRCFVGFTVTPRELAAALSTNPSPSGKEPRVVPLSASWFLPNSPRTGRAVYTHSRIPGSRFFDLDLIKHPDSPYPHMLPTSSIFSTEMSKLGINKHDTVVVYDSAELGIFSAPRVAWTLRVFGHEKVHLLDNFKVWVEEGLPTEGGEEKQVGETDYGEVKMNGEMVIGFDGVKDWAERGDKKRVQVIDARPGGRFKGVDPEPRPGLPSGHIPGAISVPFSGLVDPVTKKMKSGNRLKDVLLDAGVDPDQRVEKILMCGTGVTAVVVEIALDLAGIGGKKRVYDGSWTEWAQRATEDSGLIVKDQE